MKGFNLASAVLAAAGTRAPTAPLDYPKATLEPLNITLSSPWALTQCVSFHLQPRPRLISCLFGC